MAGSSLTARQQFSARLAAVRQNIALLKSQLKAGVIEREYWSARLDDLSRFLEDVSQLHEAGDQQRRLAALYEVSKALGSSLDLNEVLNQVMDAIIQLTGAERGALMLFDEDGQLDIKAARNVAKETLSEDEFAYSRSVIRTVAETGEPVTTTNAAEDPRFASQTSVVAHNLRSIQCVPLRARGTIIGVIYVDNRIRSGVFFESDLEMLTAFASQAAVAIENARLFTMTDKALAAHVEELSMMQEIDRQLNQTLDFDRVMGLTLEWAMRVTGADNGAIGLIDLEAGKTRIVAQHGETPAAVLAMLSSGDSAAENKTKGLAVPIQREGRIIGVIGLDRKDGKPFDQQAYSFLLRLAEHAAISIENAQLYEAVKRANDAKSEFVSVVTHELRIPMTSIRGYSEMLGMIGQLNDQQKNFLNIIRNNVDRMGVLISDLSDISRIESNRLNLEIEDNVSVRQVLDQVLPAMQAEIDKRGHRLVVDIPPDLPPVRVDPKRLEQIFNNLISNAYKYTLNGGTITIRARKSEEMVVCEVSDTGFGMTPEELGHLFTKFWRSEDVQVREQPGTGLGLAVTKNLIELQGGKISVQSTKGVGTTFSFTMPIGKQ